MIGNALSVVREVSLSIRDFVYPPQCPVCRVLIEDSAYPVCDKCLDSMEVTGEFDSSDFPDHQPEQSPFRQIRVLYLYEEPARTIIHQFKYSAKKSLAEPLGKRLAHFIECKMPSPLSGEKRIIVPVPLNPLKQIIRGYNQSALLAHEVGRSSGLPVVEDVLVRARYTRTQTALSKDRRRLNIREAFRLTREGYFTDKSVILIDDVITTASTVTECARIIEEDGCKEISIFGLAAPHTEEFKPV